MLSFVISLSTWSFLSAYKLVFWLFPTVLLKWQSPRKASGLFWLAYFPNTVHHTHTPWSISLCFLAPALFVLLSDWLFFLGCSGFTSSGQHTNKNVSRSWVPFSSNTVWFQLVLCLEAQLHADKLPKRVLYVYMWCIYMCPCRGVCVCT